MFIYYCSSVTLNLANQLLKFLILIILLQSWTQKLRTCRCWLKSTRRMQHTSTPSRCWWRSQPELSYSWYSYYISGYFNAQRSATMYYSTATVNSAISFNIKTVAKTIQNIFLRITSFTCCLFYILFSKSTFL